MEINSEILESALSLLGELLQQEDSLHFVVCGGSSLIALNLIQRTTEDVDVLARVDSQGGLITAKPLADSVRNAAAKVAAEMDLDPEWFNAGPSDESFFRLGLPEGLEDRLTTKSFGSRLTIGFISRYDQIFFKLYAAVDRGGRQFQDLQALAPHRDELLAAARWTKTQDPSEGFHAMLLKVLAALNHEDLGAEI